MLADRRASGEDRPTRGSPDRAGDQRADEQELALARQVQQSVLPRTFPDIPGYRFAARNAPARQVGGDFYDVILLDEGRFGLVIADVSIRDAGRALHGADAQPDPGRGAP